MGKYKIGTMCIFNNCFVMKFRNYIYGFIYYTEVTLTNCVLSRFTDSTYNHFTHYHLPFRHSLRFIQNMAIVEF